MNDYEGMNPKLVRTLINCNVSDSYTAENVSEGHIEYSYFV